ncbi:MAG: hypothetical protein KAS12_06385 [Candidatus Aenigmarchaeota archaeon]|nr:hypothetical protein [Candidatus Aenigmarchaeota archaeon]
MINGFKNETKQLTEYELKLIPIIVDKIKFNIGKDNAVKNKDIIRFLTLKGYEKITAVRIRKLIHFIRVKKLVSNLIATSKGYYRATTKDELNNFVESLQQRINSIEEVKKSFII